MNQDWGDLIPEFSKSPWYIILWNISDKRAISVVGSRSTRARLKGKSARPGLFSGDTAGTCRPLPPSHCTPYTNNNVYTVTAPRTSCLLYISHRVSVPAPFPRRPLVPRAAWKGGWVEEAGWTGGSGEEAWWGKSAVAWGCTISSRRLHLRDGVLFMGKVSTIFNYI